MSHLIPAVVLFVVMLVLSSCSPSDSDAEIQRVHTLDVETIEIYQILSDWQVGSVMNHFEGAMAQCPEKIRPFYEMAIEIRTLSDGMIAACRENLIPKDSIRRVEWEDYGGPTMSLTALIKEYEKMVDQLQAKEIGIKHFTDLYRIKEMTFDPEAKGEVRQAMIRKMMAATEKNEWEVIKWLLSITPICDPSENFPSTSTIQVPPK